MIKLSDLVRIIPMLGASIQLEKGGNYSGV